MIQEKCNVCLYKEGCGYKDYIALEGIDDCLKFSAAEKSSESKCTERCIIENSNTEYSDYVLIGVTPCGVDIHVNCNKVQLTMAVAGLQRMFEKTLDSLEPDQAIYLLNILLANMQGRGDVNVEM